MARGTLRIYMGAAPGVGTTFAMLAEGQRRARRGTRVVIGMADIRDRPRTADLLELVDMTPEALRRRLAHGNIVAPERVDATIQRLYRPGTLSALRELALLWVADRVEESLLRYMDAHDISGSWETRERVIVAMTGAVGNDT